jgi:hypothetical protein
VSGGVQITREASVQGSFQVNQGLLESGRKYSVARRRLNHCCCRDLVC